MPLRHLSALRQQNDVVVASQEGVVERQPVVLVVRTGLNSGGHVRIRDARPGTDAAAQAGFEAMPRRLAACLDEGAHMDVLGSKTEVLANAKIHRGP